MAQVKTTLTIAGSDSGGGAGIQADLKTFVACGVYGTSAITAVTAQNTLGVQGAFALPAEFVAQQIDSVLDDIGADAVKTGMLANAKIVRTVAAKLRARGVKNLVVDPVAVATSGDRLLDEDAISVVVEELLPLATVITPNRHEAAALLGTDSIDDMERAAHALQALGPQLVVVTGGDAKGDVALDAVFDGHEYYELEGERIDTRNTHGSGCTFSSAIAAGLALGAAPHDAIAAAKDYVTEALRQADAIHVGAGRSGLHHFFG